MGQAVLGGWFMGVVRFGCACVYGIIAILSIGYFRGGEWVGVGGWVGGWVVCAWLV